MQGKSYICLRETVTLISYDNSSKRQTTSRRPAVLYRNKAGYLYIDKTDLVWQLANTGKKYKYLSRPRRFGKSILVDTLCAYFEGKKELFEGLKIMEMEKEWTKRPVIRLDMSRAGSTAKNVRLYLNKTFSFYEEKFEVNANPDDSLANRFADIIEKAYRKSGQQVAILIDEYDSALQHSWKTPEHTACRDIYRDVFAILKVCDEFEKFVFITGITKFTQISLFSVLNNLSNVSFDGPFAALCGITVEETVENFMPEIEAMGQKNGWTADETIEQLKANYDGYHFSADNMVDVFNPFSLVNALSDGKIRNYWAASGATSILPMFVNDFEIRLADFDHCSLLGIVAESSDVTGGGPELFLYQTGYLTIKDYQMGVYFLGFPNHEVRQALNEMVLPALAMTRDSYKQSAQGYLFLALQLGKVDDAMKNLKALVADVPYSNLKLASMNMEERYRLVMSTIFNAIGCRVEVERMLATGRIDIVVEVTNYVYVIELKLTNNGGLAAAEKQIVEKGYTEPFKGGKRAVKALAIELNDYGRGLTAWKEVEG